MIAATMQMAALAPYRVDGLRDLFAGRRLAGRDQPSRPLLGQPLRNGPADAPRRSSHDRNVPARSNSDIEPPRQFLYSVRTLAGGR
jgi:hypothetical protein